MTRLLTMTVPEYPQFKMALVRNMVIVCAVITLLLLVFYPTYAIYYSLGSTVAFCYLFSLFLSVEAPKRRLTIILSIIRMALVGFLLVWLGQFRLLETTVVFSGFLSYKCVLVAQIVWYSVGTKLKSGK